MYEIQQGKVLGPVPGAQQPYAALQAEGRAAGKGSVERDQGMLVDR